MFIGPVGSHVHSHDKQGQEELHEEEEDYVDPYADMERLGWTVPNPIPHVRKRLTAVVKLSPVYKKARR